MNLKNILSTIKQTEDTNIKEQTRSSFQEDERVLTLKKGVKYVGRIVPDQENPDTNTLVTYEECGFTSLLDGTFVYLGRSPSNAKIKDDPIKKLQWDTFKKARAEGNVEGEKKSYALMPGRRQMVNFYLHEVQGEDPEAKEKIGKVVVLKYPAKLDYKDKKNPVPKSDIYALIYAALWGENAKKIGDRAFDLSANGRSLIVKVTDKDGWKCYSQSSFDDAEDLGLTAKQQQDVYKSIHKLSDFIPEVKSNEEIQQLLNEHWFCLSSSPEDRLTEDERPDEDNLVLDINDSSGDPDIDDLIS